MFDATECGCLCVRKFSNVLMEEEKVRYINGGLGGFQYY